MKHFYKIILLTLFSAAVTPVAAQISVDKVDAQSENVTFKDSLKNIPVETEYFNLARHKAERAAIRKERNYLEFGGGLQGALTNYNESWIAVSGGDNSIALMANMFLHHTFTKNRFVLETKLDAKFGYNRMKVETTNADGDKNSEGIWFKNQDEFIFSTAPSFKMTKNWSYGAMFKFRSQFSTGYVSRTEQQKKHQKSMFMTPGYLDLSVGVTYKCPKPKFPIVINLAPVALSATFAENDWIRRRQTEMVDKDGVKEEVELKPAYSYGIEDPDKTSKYEGGSSIQIDFDRTFGKSGFLRYRTTIFSFFGWITDIGQPHKYSNYGKWQEALGKWEDKSIAGISHDIKDKPRLAIHPTVRWENKIDIKATKFLTTTFSFQLYYNRAQWTDVQTQMLLSVGLTYTFKNKEKK